MSSLDQRIQRDLEGTGLPFHVEDERLLDWLAALLDDAQVEKGGADAVA